MFRDYGIYRFAEKRLAFRNDYCLYCKAERRTEQYQAFLVGYLLWIPLLPLGFRKKWYCPECWHDPHEDPTRKPQLKWVAIGFLLMFALAAWIEPVSEDFALGTWILRLGAPAGATLLLYTLIRKRENPSLAELLARIQPASETTCPFCETPLMLGSTTSCPECGVLRV